MKFYLKKVLAMLIMVVVFSSSVIIIEQKPVEASVEYITIETFAKLLTKELGFVPVGGLDKSKYINPLLNSGIIKEGDFTSSSDYLTRADAALLMNRADEFLAGGDKLDPELVELTFKERISDINKIAESKRTDVVKAYLKGFMKGYSNGAYSTNRELRGSSKLTKTGAYSLLKLLKDKSLRAKISPDGQLIRTTKLPKNAKLFPYILDSFPNKYYEWNLGLEGVKLHGSNGKEIELVNLKDYASPVNIDMLNNEDFKDFKTLKNEHINEWVEMVKNHLKLLLSADYRTIDDNWKNKVLSLSYSYGTDYEWFPQRLINDYVKNMKENKTIIEYSKIAIDGSSLYFVNKRFYMLVYVKYRIVSSEVSGNIDLDTLLDREPYNSVLLSNDLVDIRGFKKGEWIEGYYRVQLDYLTKGDMGIVGVGFRLGKGI